MPRMQVYLPTDLYQIVKERQLPASELLQEAVRSEVRRRKLQSASRRYTAELAAQVGQPSSRERARATAVAQRIAGRTDRKAG
jgi:post-segregation antitoxin (ccd killing protein)